MEEPTQEAQETSEESLEDSQSLDEQLSALEKEDTNAELVAEIKKLKGQKAYYREKAKKLEVKSEEKKDEPKPAEPDRIARVEESLTDIQLSQRGYDEETIGFLKTFAKGAAKSPSEVLDDPAVTAFVAHRKELKAKEEAVLSPSNRSLSSGGKTFGEMSEDERRAAFAKRQLKK